MKTLTANHKSRHVLPSLKPKLSSESIRDAERTQQAILAAAEDEFADKGLAGARVDTIAEQSGVNKRMLYYYFGSKEKLYIAVLERAYRAMRQAETALNLTHLEPLDAIKAWAEFKFDYFLDNPTIIPLLAGENMHNARFLKRARNLRAMHLSLLAVLRKIIAKVDSATQT